jgi:hypothetical protein
MRGEERLDNRANAAGWFTLVSRSKGKPRARAKTHSAMWRSCGVYRLPVGPPTCSVYRSSIGVTACLSAETFLGRANRWTDG